MSNQGGWWGNNAQPPVNKVFGTQNQKNSGDLYGPPCTGCSGQGCSAFNCSIGTTWTDCTSLRAAPKIDATGQTYNPDGKDFTDHYETCAFTCPSKPICGSLNLPECFLGKSSQGIEPTYRADWGPLRMIKCTYDLDKIDTLDQIFKYRELYNPQPGDQSWFDIMSKFCAAQSTNCYKDPTTGETIKSCSMVTNNMSDRGSMLCKNWYQQLPGPMRDAFIQYICTLYPNNPECKCELRAYNETFQKLSKYFSSAVEDACVWVPCKGSSPAFLVNSRDSNPKCPTTLCQVIYDVHDVQGNVEIKNNQNWLACKPPEKDPNTGEIIPHPPIEPPEPPSIPVSPSSPLTMSQKIGIGVCLGLLGLGLIMMVIRKKI